jgi:cobalt-zinc-cadmium resistance protein CzcA
VAETQERVGQHVPLSSGYHPEWTGEFGELKEAQRRLAVIVPLSLLLIIILLYSMFNSLRDSLLALTAFPLRRAGGSSPCT